MQASRLVGVECCLDESDLEWQLGKRRVPNAVVDLAEAGRVPCDFGKRELTRQRTKIIVSFGRSAGNEEHERSEQRHQLTGELARVVTGFECLIDKLQPPSCIASRQRGRKV